VYPRRPAFIEQFTASGERMPATTPTTTTAEGFVLGFHSMRTDEQEQKLAALLWDNRSVFSWGIDDLGSYCGPLGPMAIPVYDVAKRVFAPCPRKSEFELQVEAQKVPPLISAGLIERALGSQYACRNVIVAKKDAEGNYTDTRYCHDFRRLNECCPPAIWMLPLGDQLLQAVAGHAFISRVDCRSMYWQLPIAEEDRPETAFWYNNTLYQYKVVPFGLRNAPAAAQERMQRAIDDAGCGHFLHVFIDDIACVSATFEQHLEHLQKLFDIMRSINIKLHPDKSVFAAEQLEFLGHNVGLFGISPSSAKVAAIRALPVPGSVKPLQQVLGFMGYYRGYVPDFSAIARPLNDLTAPKADWRWRPDVEGAAFSVLKDRLCDPKCALRKAQPGQPFVLHTDFSNVGLGAVLGQVDSEGREGIVACISRSLNGYERNYASYKGEMLAAVWAVKSFAFYLRGTTFTLVTGSLTL
jgi:hypothetical protein